MYTKKQREDLKSVGIILMIPFLIMISPVLLVLAICGGTGSGIFGSFFKNL